MCLTCLGFARSVAAIGSSKRLKKGLPRYENPAEVDKHGNPNVLTADRPTSAVSQAPTAHSTLVEVEPYRGALPEVTAFDPPVADIAAE